MHLNDISGRKPRRRRIASPSVMDIASPIMGRQAYLVFVCWLTLNQLLCGAENIVNSSIIKDDQSSGSATRFYRNTPLAVYASALPYGAYSFHVPAFAAVPKTASSQLVPVREEAVVIRNTNGYLKDSYGNKFVNAPQSLAYKATFPQQFVQLQDLPAHLSQPLVAASPSHQVKQSVPYYAFGSPYKSLYSVPRHSIGYRGLSQPLVYAGSVNSLAPSAAYRVQSNSFPAYQYQPTDNRAVYANMQRYYNQKNEPKFQRLEQRPQSASYVQANSNGNNKENKGEAHLQAAPAKQTTITTLPDGQKVVVNIDTKPPVPLLDLNLLEPLTFANPIVPQVQHFLPKINSVTYHKLPQLDIDEVNKHQKEFVVQKTKSYDSGVIVDKPKNLNSADGNHKRPTQSVDDDHEVIPPKPTILFESDDPEFSYEIKSPNFKETYNEQVVSYNKETKPEPVEYSYNKNTQNEPVTYSYAHSSKEPAQIKHLEYESNGQAPKHLIYNFKPEEHVDVESHPLRSQTGRPHDSRELPEKSEEIVYSPKHHNVHRESSHGRPQHREEYHPRSNEEVRHGKEYNKEPKHVPHHKTKQEITHEEEYHHRPNNGAHHKEEYHHRPNHNIHHKEGYHQRPNQEPHHKEEYHQRPNPEAQHKVVYHERTNQKSHHKEEYPQKPNPEAHHKEEYHERPNQKSYHKEEYHQRPNAETHHKEEYHNRPNQKSHHTEEYHQRPNPEAHLKEEYYDRPSHKAHHKEEYHQKSNPETHHKEEYERVNKKTHPNLEYHQRPNPEAHHKEEYHERPNQKVQHKEEYHLRPNQEVRHNEEYHKPNEQVKNSDAYHPRSTQEVIRNEGYHPRSNQDVGHQQGHKPEEVHRKEEYYPRPNEEVRRKEIHNHRPNNYDAHDGVEHRRPAHQNAESLQVINVPLPTIELQPITPQYEEEIKILPTHKPHADIKVDPGQHIVPNVQIAPEENPHTSSVESHHNRQNENHHSLPITQNYEGPTPHVLEKSKRIIIQEETPDEMHSHREQMMAEIIKQEENNEEDFEKSYKDAAYGFPTLQQESDEIEKDIYNPEAYGVPRYREYNFKDTPFEQYEEEGNNFPKSSRLTYKDSRDKTKNDYIAEYLAHKPEVFSNSYKNKKDYYKTYEKYKPEKFFAVDSEKNDKKEKQNAKYTLAPSYEYKQSPEQKQTQYFAQYKAAPERYGYDYSKVPSRDSFAHASRPHQRFTALKTHFVEPQFQYGFEPISLPRLLDSELAAMASNDSPESETPGLRKKVYKENWYIKKTSTSGANPSS